MNVETLNIEGAKKLTFPVHEDERGFFREWFKESHFFKVDPLFSVKQANMSQSKKNVIRGIHFSVAPEGQAKLVTVISGHITDVLIDLRIGSPTFLKVVEIELTDDSGEAIFIPTGVGHGFLVHSESAKIVYLTSGEYSPEFENSVCPTDPDLGISWKIASGKKPIISRTDQNSPKLSNFIGEDLLPKYLGNH